MMGVVPPWQEARSPRGCSSRTPIGSAPRAKSALEGNDPECIGGSRETDDAVEASEAASTAAGARAPSRESHTSSMPCWLHEGSELWDERMCSQIPSSPSNPALAAQTDHGHTNDAAPAEAESAHAEAEVPCPLSRLYNSLVTIFGEEPFDHSSCGSGLQSPERASAARSSDASPNGSPPTSHGLLQTQTPSYLASSLVPLGGLGQPICALRGRRRGRSAPAAGEVRGGAAVFEAAPLVLPPFDGVGFGIVADPGAGTGSFFQGLPVRPRRGRSAGTQKRELRF